MKFIIDVNFSTSFIVGEGKEDIYFRRVKLRILKLASLVSSPVGIEQITVIYAFPNPFNVNILEVTSKEYSKQTHTHIQKHPVTFMLGLKHFPLFLSHLKKHPFTVTLI